MNIGTTVKVSEGSTNRKKNGVPIGGGVVMKTWNPDWGDDIDGMSGPIVDIQKGPKGRLVFLVDLGFEHPVGLVAKDIELCAASS